jgi:microcompartment protein CcmK/EutM
MRIAEVIGRVVLSERHPALDCGRLLIVWPQDLPALQGKRTSQAKPLVAYDELNPGIGAQVAVTEGREAAAVFGKRLVPIEAYVSAIIDRVEVDEG